MNLTPAPPLPVPYYFTVAAAHAKMSPESGLVKMFRRSWLVWFLVFLPLVACSVFYVPFGHSANMTIVKGGLVETLAFADGSSLTIQVTGQDVPEYSYLTEHVLTIGNFSPVWGSDFIDRTNIFCESAIRESGSEIFFAGPVSYRVIWQQIDGYPVTDSEAAVFFSHCGLG